VRPWPQTLRARLTLWYTALLTFTLLVLGATSAVLLDRSLRANLDTSLKSVAQVIAESSRRDTLGPDLDTLLESMLGLRFAERFFQLLDPFGRPDPRLVPRGRVELLLSVKALRNAERGRETYETLPQPSPAAAPLRVLTFPVADHGRLVSVVQVAMSLESVETARWRFVMILVALLPLALGGAGAGGWFLARHALAPVDAIVAAARRIEAEDLSQRIDPAEGSGELGRLATVLNDMLARLERAFDVVRQFSADAAHELRTPLTILRGEIEVALRSPAGDEEYRRVLGSCLEEVNRLTTLVDDLLFLARTDGGTATIERKPVNLSDVLADAVPALQALADVAGVHFGCIAPASVWVSGNASLLFRLIFNLAENGIKYTPSGGTVEVSLRQDGSEGCLDVRDTGPGISRAERERIFQRFYRADPARGQGGTGLGLALARSIVVLHNGRIDVDSTVGQGTRFHVAMPAVTPPR